MDHKRRPLLEIATRDAVSRIVARCLAAAAKGLSRLDNPDDPKGLHAFRVAVRRLRSVLRAFKPWTGRLAGRKIRRKLRELSRDTNAARDVEVHLAWLEGQYASLSRNERPGCSWLIRRLRDRRRRAFRSVREHLEADVADVTKRIRERMKEAADIEPSPYRAVLAGLVQAGAAKVRTRMAVISGADDEEGIHQARIQVKRLRYLVEPLLKESPEARDVVRALRDLQDLLGALHDRHVLEDELARLVEEAATEKARRLHALAVAGRREALAREQRCDESIGLVALAVRARQDRDRLFAQVRRDWLGHDDSLLSREVDALLRTLAVAA